MYLNMYIQPLVILIVFCVWDFYLVKSIQRTLKLQKTKKGEGWGHQKCYRKSQNELECWRNRQARLFSFEKSNLRAKKA
jgi:hypothetical protein